MKYQIELGASYQVDSSNFEEFYEHYTVEARDDDEAWAKANALLTLQEPAYYMWQIRSVAQIVDVPRRPPPPAADPPPVAPAPVVTPPQPIPPPPSKSASQKNHWLVIILFIVGGIVGLVVFTTSNHSPPASITPPPNSQPPLDAQQVARNAEAQWPAFWAAFSTAVRKRDRQALQGMMPSSSFQFYSDNPTPDQAIKYFDTWDTGRDWLILEQLILKSTDSYRSPNPADKPPSRVAKARRGTDPAARLAIFNFGNEQRWRWIFYGQMEAN